MVLKKQKTLMIALAVMAWIAWASALGLKWHYTWSMPEKPEISHGRTVAVMGYYRKQIYLSPAEKMRLQIAFCAAGAGVLAYLCVFLFFHYRNKKQGQP